GTLDIGTRHDLQQVVEAGGSAVVNGEIDHGEQHAFLLRQSLLRITECAQPFGAGALEGGDVAGMVDDTARIRILVVDPYRPAEFPCRHGAPSSNSDSVFSARVGTASPRCR